jgi:hypothetical protein
MMGRAAQPLPIARLTYQIARSIRRFALPSSSSLDAILSGQHRNRLHEVKDALGAPIFLAQSGFDDFRGLGFGNVDSRLA